MKDALQSPSALNQDGCLTHEGCSPAPDDNRLLTSTDKESIKITRKYVPVLTRPKRPRVSGRVRYVYLVSGCLLFVVSLVLMVAGTIRVNQCNKEEERKWGERFIEENVDQFVSTNNFALEKPTKQSSDHVEETRGHSELAVDGDSQTCSQTDEEIWPWWWVDLKTIRPIEAVIIKGSPNQAIQHLVSFRQRCPRQSSPRVAITPMEDM
ncbi:uncharacterized protein LOC125670894 isoform X2 [Ostrea edulis]|uniref:uncharacterized protein LOC125670894 isoform X2 n=1 Tax=Ostrea edulis TaxID=37623 RepID=UPI00209536AB|nr:uncharacterized protein LOC125670894 isoform X2 [Ostrea edulis]